VAIILDTSFNKTEPVVCEPKEALDGFLRTRMAIRGAEDLTSQKRAYWYSETSMNVFTWSQLKALGLEGVTQAALYKVRCRIPRFNPNYFLSEINGLIHVGAHYGQERKMYAKRDLNVLWVEAAPDIFERLCENIRAYPSQTAVNRLLTDRDDAEYVFHIANNDGESSSILELHDHKKIWPEVRFERDLRLKSITLDSLLVRLNKPITCFQALVMDTQGSELLVLKGAMSSLRFLKFVKVEAWDFEAYLGCPKINDVVDYLNDYDFQLIRQDKFAQPIIDSGQCYELLFRKRRT
jgi:FkbM family methyltransferase